MTLLLWLTLAYVVVLVLTLAFGLGAAWIRLRGIDRALCSARDALRAVRDATEPLEQHIEPLREPLFTTVASLEDAAQQLSAAREQFEPFARQPATGRAQ